MIYLDTSVVVALLTPEERSAQALDWFAQSRDPLISSDWLITETHSALRWVPFIGQFRPLTSLTPGGRNRIRSQYRPHGEFYLPGSCEVLHGSTSTESEPG